MKKLRIAFCGPNPTINHELVRFLRNDLLLDRNPTVLDNNLRQFLSDDNPDFLEWINLWSSTFRSLNRMKLNEELSVVSASCGIDEVVGQAAVLAEQMMYSQTLALPSSMGNLDASGINKTGSILQVLLNQAEQEVADWWTFVYAVIPVSSKLSIAPSEIITQYDDFLSSVPVFSDVKRIPDNLTSAQDFLKKEAEEWKAYLNS